MTDAVAGWKPGIGAVIDFQTIVPKYRLMERRFSQILGPRRTRR